MTQPFTTSQPDDGVSLSMTSSTTLTMTATVTPGLNVLTLPAADPNYPCLRVENLCDIGSVFYMALGYQSAAPVSPPGGPNPLGRRLTGGFQAAWTNDIQGQAGFLSIFVVGIGGTVNLCRFR